MIKTVWKNVFGWLVFGTLLIPGACTDHTSGNATVQVRLTDAPAEYQQVNVDIQDVQVHAEGGDQDGGWISLPINRGVYNLLELTNGLDTLLGTAILPVGKISQVRLVLGENNTIRTNDVSADLNTPSAQQSGLKVQVNTELKEGITYTIVLDFDAARSVVATGSGKFNLKPVIRAVTTAQDGAIRGSVTPTTTQPVVYAINGADTVSTYANETGSFLVRGLAPATYRLVLVANTGATVEKNEVAVQNGEVTDVGIISF